MTATSVGTARVFPGRVEYAGEVRRLVRAQLGPACGTGSDAELAACELFANACLHTRSGGAGGTVTVAVTADRDWLTIHVHDLGTGGGRWLRGGPVPVPPGGGCLAIGGRGLQLVAAICVEWGAAAAASCVAAGSGDPAAVAGGCCTWCRLNVVAARQQVRSGHRPFARDTRPARRRAVR